MNALAQGRRDEDAADDDRFRILVVCTGNVIRSPFAAALMQASFDAHLPGRVEVGSAGTASRRGQPVDGWTREELEGRGLDASAHRSRMLTAPDLRAADLVLGMTEQHTRAALELAPSGLRVTFMLTALQRIVVNCDGIVELDPDDDPTVGPTGRMRSVIRAADRCRELGAGARAVQDPRGLGIEVHREAIAQVDAAAAAIVTALLSAKGRS
ncbi:hypothetical protein DEO23_10110 [Brachybacterium endophyticum]|uniref:Phosphotyrosine protein phosphatase I domain-containing protein n=1 Tax=Brachybacterium endophyticum TaxID=2182385 RepID=A0A2U2RJW3_9MICO|nr:hypothetical protein [Brachybacterium endophyticum]PWH06150.1 hypothetical protein DEO23_10110 [Brachybacterium endophyticum]